MKCFLVKGEINWADEIDFDGYVIVDEETFKSDREVLETLVNKYPDYEQEVGCGTNEEVTISPKEVLAELDDAILLSDSEYGTFDRYGLTFVGRTCYNMFNIEEAESYIKKKREKIERKKVMEMEKKKAIENKKQNIEDLQNFFRG